MKKVNWRRYEGKIGEGGKKEIRTRNGEEV